MSKTIQQLASEYLSAFELRTRSNDEKYYCVKDSISDAPDYYENSPLNKLIREAHGERMPNDYIYRYIVESLDLISSCENIGDIIIECDIYTNDLIAWLSDSAYSIEYCNEAMCEFELHNIIDIMQNGQILHKQEILQSVINSLENQID